MKKLFFVLFLLVSALVLFAGIKTIGKTSNFKISPEVISTEAEFIITVEDEIYLEINVYNKSGICVANVVSGFFVPENYTFVWDRTSNSGEVLEKGVYEVQVKEDKRFVTKRKTLILK